MVSLSTDAMQPAAPPPDCSKHIKSIGTMAKPLGMYEKRMKKVVADMHGNTRMLMGVEKELVTSQQQLSMLAKAAGMKLPGSGSSI